MKNRNPRQKLQKDQDNGIHRLKERVDALQRESRRGFGDADYGKRARKTAHARRQVTTRGTNLREPHPSLLPAAIADYTDALGDPDSTPVKVPFNINNVLTSSSMTARTTHVAVSMQVAGNTCTQLDYWPGHGRLHIGGQAPGSRARVSEPFNVGLTPGTDYNFGPMDSTGVAPTKAAMGVITRGIGIGSNTTQLAGGNSFAIIPDNPLPYTFDRARSDAVRWRLTSLHVKVLNTTIALKRGGTVSSCQPDNTLDPQAAFDGLFNGQGQFGRFKSFKMHGIQPGSYTNDDGELCMCTHARASAEEDPCFDCDGWISWIPRPQDISYWRVEAGGNDASQQILTPGLKIWLNADGDAMEGAQTYQIHTIANWEIAGNRFKSTSTPALHNPLAEEILPETGSYLRNGTHTAAEATKMAQITAASSDASFNKLAHEAAGFIKKGAPYAVEALLSQLPDGLAKTTASMMGAVATAAL